LSHIGLFGGSVVSGLIHQITMGRRLLVVESGVDQSVLADPALAGREVLSKESLRTFTGEESNDVLYLCTNPQAFEDDSALFDDLLDKVMAASGSLSIKIMPPGDAGSAQALARALRLNGFVEVEVKEDGLVCGKKDSVEVCLKAFFKLKDGSLYIEIL